MIKPDERLSPHFRYREFFSRGKAPPLHLHRHLGQLTAALEVLRAELGGAPIRVLSGYRSPAHNADVNGAPASQHMLAAAADIRVNGVPYFKVAETIEMLVSRQQMPQGGLGIYDIDEMVHYDVRWRKSRWRQNSDKKWLSGDDFYHGEER